jgi:hypothetical protein
MAATGSHPIVRRVSAGASSPRAVGAPSQCGAVALQAVVGGEHSRGGGLGILAEMVVGQWPTIPGSRGLVAAVAVKAARWLVLGDRL